MQEVASYFAHKSSDSLWSFLPVSSYVLLDDSGREKVGGNALDISFTSDMNWFQSLYSILHVPSSSVLKSGSYTLTDASRALRIFP